MALSSHGQHEGEEQNLERWLITYADMITLLMAFFIMMYAMSVIDLRKFEALAHSMGAAFGGAAAEIQTSSSAGGEGLLTGGEALLSGTAGHPGNSATLVNRIRADIKSHLPERLRDSVEITHCGGVVTVRIKADSVTFGAGKAALTADAKRILDAIGPTLRAAGSPMRVEGHTCDLPINTARFPSNWELSAQRAANVMAYLIRCCGIPPTKITSAGFAHTRPLVPNRDEASRARNRRVDILIAGPPTPQPIDTPASRAQQTNQKSSPAASSTIDLEPVRLVPPIDLWTRYQRSKQR